MANRILRDWTDSEKIDKLSFQAEVFFVRLFMKADDYGSFHGNIKLLKSSLFPLRCDSVRDADISRWMHECQTAELIAVYQVQSKPYISVINFGQRLRNMTTKFPQPNDGEALTSDSNTPLEEETKKKLETETKQKQLTLPWDSEKFKEHWQIWKRYKKEEHKESYKSELTEQAALKKLCALGGGSEEIAMEIIEESISNSWKGLFPLKNQDRNGNNKTGKQEKFAAYFKQKSREGGVSN